MKSIFSVDVEDWFHILDLPSTPKISEWEGLPSHVERNFRKLLDIFSDAGVRTTCFFLGWTGQKFPHLVKEAAARGHEIASHGYAHALVNAMTPMEFQRDISSSKRILEDLSSREVCGYRAPGFSVSAKTPWFFSEVAKAGYAYDTSVFPISCGHGGLKSGLYRPYAVRTDCGDFLEFPVTVARVLGRRVCLFGGGYLRLAPLALIERKMQQVIGEGRPVVCYVHPREIEPGHPRLPMTFTRRFKSYVNLGTTEAKIRYLLSRFEFTSFREFLDENASSLPERKPPEGARTTGNTVGHVGSEWI